MKARKLTPAQKDVFKLLSKTPNGILRQHIKPSGTVCYRVLDEKFNPLRNVNENVVDRLFDK